MKVKMIFKVVVVVPNRIKTLLIHVCQKNENNENDANTKLYVLNNCGHILYGLLMREGTQI